MAPRIQYFLLSLVFFLYAIYLCWRIYAQGRKTAASRSWPAAKVMILSKTVVERYARNRRSWKEFTPKIFYLYIVDGEYITGVISLKPEYTRNPAWIAPDSELKARKIAKRHLEEMPEKIEIHYNPKKPKERVCSLDPIRNDVPRLILSLLVALSLAFLSFGF